MHPVAFSGALLHVVAHSTIKDALFLCAGAIIHQTGKTYVRDLRGIGKEMPITIWCWTIASLGLIGIPPTGGFVSKWYLAQGALNLGSAACWIGPAVLLCSALMTAGYLLPVTIHGYFPGEAPCIEGHEAPKRRWIPMLILAVLVVLVGAFPGALVNYAQTIANLIF